MKRTHLINGGIVILTAAFLTGIIPTYLMMTKGMEEYNLSGEINQKRLQEDTDASMETTRLFALPLFALGLGVLMVGILKKEEETKPE